MKKVFLLLLLLCFFSFSENEGFIDLKWGASKEETLKYMKNTFGVEPIINESNAVVYNSKNIKLEELELSNITFFYEDNKKFYSWTGTTPSVNYNGNYIKNKLKKNMI